MCVCVNRVAFAALLKIRRILRKKRASFPRARDFRSIIVILLYARLARFAERTLLPHTPPFFHLTRRSLCTLKHVPSEPRRRRVQFPFLLARFFFFLSAALHFTTPCVQPRRARLPRSRVPYYANIVLYNLIPRTHVGGGEGLLPRGKLIS